MKINRGIVRFSQFFRPDTHYVGILITNTLSGYTNYGEMKGITYSGYSTQTNDEMEKNLSGSKLIFIFKRSFIIADFSYFKVGFRPRNLKN